MGWMSIKYTQHIYYVHGNTYESQSRKNTSMSSEQASRLIYENHQTILVDICLVHGL